ncbi:GNAT family N-acetyltransferase [Sphingomonas sp. BT-65]|uniref:GNAT family N-acetyltransferase n=1 Tax=Sphingomonas sp. BT-65 TaxID=2989821 RepID=UPI002235877E|nr:GNAT family N-acetyltransferase [Sphingomonas sp. BT-65]MCW4463035.1 GNAT family N-acetyltransferase [Sphingomonas sp. BT-65]
MPDPRIRPFEDRDWPAVRAIIDAVVESGTSYTYDSGLSDQAYRALWIEAPPGQTVVAEDADGTILGTAKVGRNQRGPGSHVANASFMVAREGRGRGIGRRLGEHVVAWAREAGFRAMQFNAVVSDNHAAVALWQSLGFDIIGTVPEGFRHRDDRFADLLIMYRRLQ